MSSSSGRLDRRGNRHGWLDLEHYLAIHDAQIRRFEDHFIVENLLAISVSDSRTLRIEGRRRSRDRLVLDVAKTLEIDERNRVRTIRYKYQAGIDATPYRPLFRYDKAHPHPGHSDEHHRHAFDPLTSESIGPPQWIGVDRWPPLAEVIDELFEWQQEAGRFLALE